MKLYKWQLFCKEMLVDNNATQAYYRAGFKAKNDNVAAVSAHRLLTNPKIAEYLQRLRDERAKRTEVTADKVIKELAKVAFFNPKIFYRDDGSVKEIKDIPDDAAACIAGLETFDEYEGTGANRVYTGTTKKIKLVDKMRALEMLGKHLGMFTDKVEVTVQNSLADLLKEVGTEEIKKDAE